MQPFSTESDMAPESLESRRQQHPPLVALLCVTVVPDCPVIGAKTKVYRDPKEHVLMASELGCQIPHLHTQITTLHLWRCSMRIDYKSEVILVTSQWPVSTTVKPEPTTNLLFPNCESICCLFSCSTAWQLQWSK